MNLCEKILSDFREENAHRIEKVAYMHSLSTIEYWYLFPKPGTPRRYDTHYSNALYYIAREISNSINPIPQKDFVWLETNKGVFSFDEQNKISDALSKVANVLNKMQYDKLEAEKRATIERVMKAE